jgi:serine protease Do
MMHRFLLSLLLLSLVASAQPDERNTAPKAETWSFGYGSDEGGSGSSYLGVDIADVTPERLSALKLKEEHGAEITMVDSDAPAGKAGLHEHDVILSLNGTAVESAAQLRRMIKETPPGRIVALGISRDGQMITIKAQLADRHESEHWAPKSGEFSISLPPVPPIPDIDLPISVVIAHSSMRSGLMVENITSQLGEFFGVKDGRGVLIRSVEKGSRGEKAGFRAGDVIVKVNNQPVHDAADFSHALRSSSGGSATVTVMRDKHEQNFTLTLPTAKDSGRLLEDSFDVPVISADTELAIRSAESEIARLAPLMQKVQQEQRQACEVAKRAQEHAQRHIEQQMKLQQERMLDQQKRMLNREQKLRHELSGQWAEI